MKKNTSKIIPLLSLILLSSCNDITYKDGNPLFIEGESIKADDSVRHKFIENISQYNNFIPDGFYNVNYSKYIIRNGEYLHYYDIESNIEYHISEKYNFYKSVELNYKIPKFTFHKKYYVTSAYDIYYNSQNEIKYIKEKYYQYNGNKLVCEFICSDNSKINIYYDNLNNKYLRANFIFENNEFVAEYNEADLYYLNNTYHFNQHFSSDKESVYYDVKLPYIYMNIFHLNLMIILINYSIWHM